MLTEKLQSSNQGIAAATDHPRFTGALIALLPERKCVEELFIPGGEPVDQLHLTLFFLGDSFDITAIMQEKITRLITLVTELIIVSKPIAELRAFGIAQWNPYSEEPAIVLNIGNVIGSKGRTLGEIHAIIRYILEDANINYPEQHDPWSPHICLGYNLSLTDYYEEIKQRLENFVLKFDRLMIGFGDNCTIVPLNVA